MGFSENDSDVRVDLFKPSGKWYTAMKLEWKKYLAKEGDIISVFKEHLFEQYPYLKYGHEDWKVVCLKPYHEHEHPLMIIL